MGKYAGRRLLAIAITVTALSAGTILPALASANVNHAANVDYASGGYGQYQAAALTNPRIQGVDINLNWSSAETSLGTYKWGPLDTAASAWANAGKHIVLIARFATEVGTGGCSGAQILPAWEQARIPTHCDTDTGGVVPDYFSSAFQSDWETFIAALGAHVAAQPYAANVSYVRIGVGLGGEGFYLLGTGMNPDFSTDKAWIVSHWGYTPQAWEAFQETMLAAYNSAFAVQVIYPVVAQDTNPSTGQPVDYDVAKWATDGGGFGIGQEGLGPGGYGSGAGYADWNNIDAYVVANHPLAKIQFQPVVGLKYSTSTVQGLVNAAEANHGQTIEWYESMADTSGYQSILASYQTWVTSTFG